MSSPKYPGVSLMVTPKALSAFVDALARTIYHAEQNIPEVQLLDSFRRHVSDEAGTLDKNDRIMLTAFFEDVQQAVKFYRSA